MADTVQELEINLLLEALLQLYGSDFRAHERSVLARKLSAFMQERRISTISALLEKVIHRRTVAIDLLRALAYRPAGAFEDAGALGNLRELAEPLLRSYARPKVWLPECATAEEVLSIAILLEEAGVYGRSAVHATCSNPALLGEIRKGRFPLSQADRYEENYAASGGRASFSAYWSRKRGYGQFDPRLLRNITFSEYNLTTDTSFNEFHLIACRNRLAELNRPLRHRVLELFAESLARFGILYTDPFEELASFPFSAHYNALSSEHGIYRRTYRLTVPGQVGALI